MAKPQPIVFGEVEGIPEGHNFKDRKEMMKYSFHRSWGRGVDGNSKEGTAAIVLSGGYEDDEDLGDEIIYTGAGGNDPNTGKQVKDQSWNNAGNAGLRLSQTKGLPIRVIRGSKHDSKYSPKLGYKYSGLYNVVDSWEERGRSGFMICRFRLIYTGLNVNRQSAEIIDGAINPGRIETTILRVIRETKIAQRVKEYYNYECQVCGSSIEIGNVRYAEGAHITPLGRPHNGADLIENLLCLCPNHHVMLDRGCFSIRDDYSLIGVVGGNLIVHSEHNINPINLERHRERYGFL